LESILLELFRRDGHYRLLQSLDLGLLLELEWQVQLVFLVVQLPTTRALLDTLLLFEDVFVLIFLDKTF